MCPRCKSPLATRIYGRAQMASCWGCGGLFVEAAQLAALLLGGDLVESTVLAAAFDGARVTPRPAPVRMAWCPCCGAPMQDRGLVEGAQTRVSVCRAHGVWIDAAHVPGAIRVFAMRAVGRAGDLERTAFADALRREQYSAILGHARELAARAPRNRALRSPLGLLGSLFA